MNDTTPTGLGQDANSAPTEGNTTRQDTLSVAEAAERLNVTHDAIRARLRRGSLEGEKRGDSWVVFLSAQESDTTSTADDTTQQDNATGDTTQPVGVDLAPLADLIDDLTRRNADLAAAAALWQSRAAFLEERVKALEAGPVERQDVSHDAPAGPESGDQEEDGVSVASPAPPRSEGVWARLWRAVTGG